jgi:two-component system LytT family response regulator
MGWFPQIENRLREIRMMIPEIHAVIADDEPLARDQLRLLLTEETGVEIVAECGDALQTIAAVKTHKPDLLLLDIEMQDTDGFQVLNSISRKDMPLVIFTSAELVKTHDRHLTHRILDLLEEARTNSHTDRRLVIKTSGRVVFVDTDEIDWLEAAGNYVEVKTSSGCYLLREGIGSLSQRLDPGQFVRIHRSIIVNVRKIKELQPCNRGEYMVVLRDGKQLSCSRGYRTKLQQLIAAQ